MSNKSECHHFGLFRNCIIAHPVFAKIETMSNKMSEKFRKFHSFLSHLFTIYIHLYICTHLIVLYHVNQDYYLPDDKAKITTRN